MCNRPKPRSCFPLLFAPVLLMSCGSGPKAPASKGSAGGSGVPVGLPPCCAGKKTAYTENYPLAWFAERIAGDAVQVVLPAPADGDPAFWKPDDKAIKAFQEADLILRNGASYAKWAGSVSLPEARVVNTSAGFKEQYITIESRTTHSHGPEGEHSHAGTDFNTWLDPQLAVLQARAVYEALCRLLPKRASVFESNLKTLVKDLEALDVGFRALVEGGTPPPLVASHPVYNYVARRYGWNLKSMLWEPEKMPDEEAWKKLGTLLETHPARHMIWEGTPSSANATKLKADLGVESVVFDPCGNRPAEGDYLSVMRRNLENLKPAFAAR